MLLLVVPRDAQDDLGFHRRLIARALFLTFTAIQVAVTSVHHLLTTFQTPLTQRLFSLLSPLEHFPNILEVFCGEYLPSMRDNDNVVSEMIWTLFSKCFHYLPDPLDRIYKRVLSRIVTEL